MGETGEGRAQPGPTILSCELAQHGRNRGGPCAARPDHPLFGNKIAIQRGIGIFRAALMDNRVRYCRLFASVNFYLLVMSMIMALAAQELRQAPQNDEQNVGIEDAPAELQVRRDWILSEVQRLRAESDINIVMDYGSHLQWNPLFSYTASEAQLHIALFEGLLAYNPTDMTPRPGLAKSWERSADGLRYTFYLRRNARFSNGEPIDAEIVARTWFFFLRAGDKAPFSSLLDLLVGVKDYREGKIPREATGIKVQNPYQLELTLKHPSPEILAILSHHSLSPLPPSLLTQQNWPALYRSLYQAVGTDVSESANGSDNLISNGPYRLKYVSEAGVQLEANPYYWNAAELASEKIFIQKYYQWQDPDISAALNAYKIDWIASGYSELKQLRRSVELIHIGKSFSSMFFYFANSNQTTKSWSEAKVRRALTLLLPLEKLRSGPGGDAHLIPEMPGFQSGKTLEEQDKDEALRLLEAAGYPDGEGLGTLVLRFPEGPVYERFATLIREAWSELKCEVEVEFGDPTALLGAAYNEDPGNGSVHDAQRAGEGDGRGGAAGAPSTHGGGQAAPSSFTLGILSWIGDYPDPTTFLNLWRGGNSLNLFEFHDPDYDALLDQARQATDRGERFKLLSQAEEYLLLNGTVIPLGHNPSFNLYDQRFLEGFYENVLDLHPLQTLRRIYRLPKGSA